MNNVDKNMNDTPLNNAQSVPSKFSIKRMLPFAVIVLAAALGFVFLRNYLSFEQLAQNQEVLQLWRDSNFVLASLVFIAIYIVIVAFSLPGAAIISLVSYTHIRAHENKANLVCRQLIEKKKKNRK